MICFPNAKINIGLNIIEKRTDGFHNIESVMYPLKGIVYDALEIITPPRPSPKEREIELITSGISIPGNNEDNLCVKAYHLIKKNYPQLPLIEIHLHKAIPSGAGLGGGSADAAFFIRLLNETFELGLAWGEMHHYAKQLGSDCSFFISNKPVFAEGKGDEFEFVNLDLSGYYIALVYPDIHINTAEAYREIDKLQVTSHSERSPSDKSQGRLESLILLPIEKWQNNRHKHFEDAIFPKYPEIKKIKDKLYSCGAIYASMSGSGSAVYGVFKKEPKV